MAKIDTKTTNRPVKKGQLMRTKDNKLALLNDKNQAFILNDEIINVWNMMDGKKSIGILAQYLALRGNADTKKIEPIVEEIVQELKKVDLVSTNA